MRSQTDEFSSDFNGLLSLLRFDCLSVENLPRLVDTNQTDEFVTDLNGLPVRMVPPLRTITISRACGIVS